MTKFKLFLFFFFIIFATNHQAQVVLAVPKLGLILKSDTIRLFEVNEKQVSGIFHINDSLTRTGILDSEGFYEKTGEPAYWEEYTKTISDGGIFFNYRGIKKDSLKLVQIEIKLPSSYLVKINESLILGKPAYHVEKYFPKKDEYDEYLDGIYFDSQTYRIILKLDSASKKLIYLALY